MASRSAHRRLRAQLGRAPEPSAGPDLGADEALVTRRILDAIEEYVYVGEILPGNGYRVLFQGPCRARFLALDPEAARLAVWAEYVHPDDRELFAAIHEQALVCGSLDGQYRIVGADGVTRWVRDRGRIRREDGRVFLDGSVLDVSVVHAVQDELLATVAQVNEANEQLELARAEADRVGRLDPLTGVANRRVLPELLDRRLAAGDEHLGVLLVDVDRFKRINDGLGHAAGDVVLVEVARRIRETIREEDTVARVGGEEFLVLLHGMSDAASLRLLGERMRAAMAGAPMWIAGVGVPVTASIGGALSGREHQAGESLLAAADRALYAAKRAGRDRVVLVGDAGAERNDESEGPELALAHAMVATAATSPGFEESHAEEVSWLAAGIAGRLGAGAHVRRRCRLAGLLHDVGKAGLPDPGGPLSDAERESLRTHPMRGAELIARVPALGPIVCIVRQHHERLDGSGYPEGLRSEAIGLEARIVAVADVYSAMTTRAGLSPGTALHALQGDAGVRFDAAVVRALASVIARRPGAPVAVHAPMARAVAVAR
jgi:diguanylate cyclase (GGDEF)-like protein